MSRAQRTALLALVGTLALLVGCGKKKIAMDPTLVASVPSPTPAPTPPPSPSAGPPPPVNSEPHRRLPPQPKAPQPEPARPTVARRTTPPSNPTPGPEETQPVTAPPGPSLPVPGQLSAALSRDDLLARRNTTTQLLEGAELNLKNLKRSLSNDEKAVLQHIRTYIRQSRSATDMGDVERAYNLALKAHLLSEELIKR